MGRVALQKCQDNRLPRDGRVTREPAGTLRRLAAGCQTQRPFWVAQALAKVERGHRQDLADVREMIARGLVEPRRAMEYFARLEPYLFRFPALDPQSFRRAVEVFEP